ncbi:MAG: anaerobic ribonucleoside-triphosphate reductase [Candidatus Parabeggiatoa sp.]|nr:anaerobic ribonucleoside-triphosphate reductase [Candidatus Parabeggiatoa sp.]
MIKSVPQILSTSDLTDSQGQILLEASERTKTEIWTRVMGYHRPISAFNPGKQSEHAERVHFRESHHVH